ncbi:MAG: response regulator transcription factor [Bacteroidota bacterium]
MARRIYIVEDHPVMREGYVSIIKGESDLEVCGEAAMAEEAFASIPDLSPDLVLLDLSLPGINGIELLKRLRSVDFEGYVLVVSAHDDVLYAERAFSAGANGYLMKQEAPRAIIEAIRHVLGGRVFVTESFRDVLMTRLMGRPGGLGDTGGIPGVEQLTDRELETFEHVGGGLTSKETAERMQISVKTVDSYKQNIKRKLGLSSATELLQQAVLWRESSLR